MEASPWLAVVVGNSRIQWAECWGTEIRRWRYGLPPVVSECWAAMVGRRTLPLQPTRCLDLSDIPIPGLYPTLGVDRALALWAGLQAYGAPLLVIDGGTALTLTAVDAAGHFRGGSISPGLAMQRQMLSERTAALPLVSRSRELPPRWANTTEAAIQSGIELGALAAVKAACQEWLSEFPHGTLVFTGGDGEWLWQHSNLSQSHWQPTLVLQGIIRVRMAH